VRCDRVVKAADIQFEPEARPLVFMDAHRIRQVMINLIRNAADALPARGGRLAIRVTADQEQVVVEVEDNGRGIPADVAARVFEPFFTTKGEKGLGLGLDISRQIVVAHGGTLTFQTLEAGGTTFRMALPLVPDPVGEPPFDDMKTDPHGHGVLSPLAGPPPES
jgi:two-component system NtrC family sensor kinase